MIPIYSPYLPKKSLKYAEDALNSTWISSTGKYLPMVQEKLQELLNVKYVLPVNNGTSACHLTAKILNNKIKKNKHKVLCPDNVYVAAINSFLFDKGAFQLITVKTDIHTWNINLIDLKLKIEKYPDASVLIVHNIGNIVNVPELQKQYPNTLFIEDNCEGLFGKYNNIYSGTSSLCSSVSFYANKTLTAGEAGAFITNDEEMYMYAKCIHGQGQSDIRFIHNELGYNYRMTNIQAAILYGQLEVADKILEMKNTVFTKYRSALKGRDDILIQQEEVNTKNSNWMFGVRILQNKNYETANIFFNQHGIEIRPMFYPLTTHKHLKENKYIMIDNCQNAELLNRQSIILPSYPELTKEEQNHILKTLNDYADHLTH